MTGYFDDRFVISASLGVKESIDEMMSTNNKTATPQYKRKKTNFIEEQILLANNLNLTTGILSYTLSILLFVDRVTCIVR